MLLRVLYSLVSDEVESTPYNVFRHALRYRGVDLDNFRDDAAEGINYISLSNEDVSKI